MFSRKERTPAIGKAPIAKTGQIVQERSARSARRMCVYVRRTRSRRFSQIAPPPPPPNSEWVDQNAQVSMQTIKSLSHLVDARRMSLSGCDLQ